MTSPKAHFTGHKRLLRNELAELMPFDIAIFAQIYTIESSSSDAEIIQMINFEIKLSRGSCCFRIF